MASPGVLHTYAPGLVAYEHLGHSSPSDNKLLFVAGLGDGLFTVPFVQHLLPALGAGGWGVIEVLTSSSYKGWGVGGVARDAEEIAKAVEYFRNSHKGVKLVLMGHSTGSQDTFQYLLNVSNGSAPALDGAVLQAPVSDREFVVENTSKTTYLTAVNFCESWIKDGRGAEVVPSEMRPMFADTPVCAERWYSLAAPLDAGQKPQGSEDFFSSDLLPETLADTFGKLPKEMPLLVLFSGIDQYVPQSVDKEKLVRSWKAAREAAGGTLQTETVPDATHNLGGVSAEIMEDFVGRLKGFLGTIAGGGSEYCSNI